MRSFRISCLAMVLLLPLGALQARDGVAREIAPGIYVWPGAQEEFSPHNKGHIANIGFMVGDQAVAVIDTGSSYQEGLELRRMISEATPLPIKYVILTHMHPDHVLGAAAFSQDKPLFIGHEQLADAMARRQSIYLDRMKQILGPLAEGTRMVFPAATVATGQIMSLDLGGRTLDIQAYPTSHTNNDLTVFDRKTGTLWLSDLLFVERIPVMDGSLLGWLKTMSRLSALDCLTAAPVAAVQSNKPESNAAARCVKVERVVPGHGPVVSQWKAALADQRRYLEFIAKGIRAVIKQGGTITQAVEQVGWEERNRWLLFDEYHGRNVTACFAELEWE
jgi:quinoprotein relay system zinc metallohydrolase 2